MGIPAFRAGNGSMGSRVHGPRRNRREGKFHRQSVMTKADGARYEGGFFRSLPHGHGVMTWPDGRRYEGEWQGGVRQFQ